MKKETKEYCDDCVWSQYDNENLGLYCEVKNEDINSMQEPCDNFCADRKHFWDLVKYGKKLQQAEIEVE